MATIPTRQQLRREAARKRREARDRFRTANKAVRNYERSLTAIAKHVGDLVKQMAPGGVVKNPAQLNQMLNRYSEMLVPYANTVAENMVNEVAQRTERAWNTLANEIGRNLREDLRKAPTQHAMQQLMDEQVALIKSLPLEAARRVQDLTVLALSDSTRAKEIAEAILKTGHVTKSRAMLIARTETSKASTNLTQVKAEHIGSTAYIWRTAEDGDVRESHRNMEGQPVSWNDPPTLDGLKGHAGALPNCRCWCEPILPDVIT